MTSATISSRFSGFPVRLLIRAALFSTVCLAVSMAPGIPGRITDTISVLSSVSATLLGFIIAAATLLISLIDRPFIRNLNKTGHMSQLWRQLVGSGTGMLLALIACLVAMTLNEKHAVYSIAVSFSFLAVAAFDLIDCTTKLMKVMARI
ncbi:hypothetical protein [Phytopseudomonas dryadis]|nr:MULTISPECIES: hypothetical protein [Pseudomonas]